MIKKISLSSVVVALLLFSGCASKNLDKLEFHYEKSPSKVELVKNIDLDVISDELFPYDTNVESSLSSAENLLSLMSVSDFDSYLSTIYFDFDKFSLNSDALNKIQLLAEELSSTSGIEYNLKLEGNCDEWGSDEYNFALGLKRASSVKKALIAEGLDTNRISMISYGESNPACSEKTDECFSKNRRVAFKIFQ